MGVERSVQALGLAGFRFDALVRADTAIYTVAGAAVWHASGLVMALFLAGLRGIDPEALASPVPEVDRLPAGATLLDLRATPAYRSWHYPGALHLDLPQALVAYRSFARDHAFVVVCEVGLKSAHLAEKMKEAGLEAYQFRGGVKGLMDLAERERKADLSLLAPAVRD